MAPEPHEEAGLSGAPLVPGWTPPVTFKERVVHSLVPGGLNWRLRAWKAYWRQRKPELRLLRQFVDPRKTSVDVGANRGVFSYYLAQLSTHVYAYEPHPKMFWILSRSVDRRRVTVSPRALSDERGASTLIVPARAPGVYSNQRATLRPELGDEHAGRCLIETSRLDEEEVGQPGFIKIDVEGCELAVLQGAAETIREHRPVLLIEIYERWSGRPVEESLAFVQGLGYEGVFFADGLLRPLQSFDAERFQRGGGPPVRDFFFLPR